MPVQGCIQPLSSYPHRLHDYEIEIIEDRHGKRSTMLTSQVPVNKWFEVIGEQTIADAILDRIIHDAHRLELKGESMRKKRIILEDQMTENEN
jgi:DNA replication protein DnaC